VPAVRRNPVYKVINKPLTICGADRRLFFCAVTLAAGIWNALDTLIGALVMLGALLLVARYITVTDPQLPRVLLNSDRFRGEYDPMKRGRATDLTISR
jgi:type IV secretory pathway TrbD component